LGLVIPNPELWWTNGLGKPALYDLEVVLRSDDRVLDKVQERVGLRTLTWDQSPDPEEPGTFFFTPVLNGVRIFAKGADWIPADIFVSAVDEDRHRELLELAAAAHMNMVRVWGGGVFENDDFYWLCDELGILVWQDFMYACAVYPDFDPGFWTYSESEARSAIQRLRNRPSLALWCGNNEVDWLDDQRVWWQPGRDFLGKRLFHELFPRLVDELDPGVTYWPSSPYGGNDHNDAAQGDRHNWQAWHGMVYPRRFGQKPEDCFTPEGVTYRHYAEDFGRFISEFGIQSSPSMETLKRSLPAHELHLGSQGIMDRVKDDPKDKGIRYLIPQTGAPADLDQYIDFSMIAQAEGLKFGIEHYRRRMPHCSGTLVWQLNDCWPGISWSLVDYYGHEKAAYYYVKRAYAPVIASFKPIPGGYELWVTNDGLESFEDEITWGLELFAGGRVVEEKRRICIDSNSSQVVAKISRAELYPYPEIGYLSVHSGQAGFPSNRGFLAEVKDLRRETSQFQILKQPVSSQEIELHLQSERFVYYVKVECLVEGTRYSDNYLDLYPGRPAIIKAIHPNKRLSTDDLRATALPA
jgi:beta-mannosidase